MWRHLSHSLQGASHIAEGSPCQDSHSVQAFGDPPDAPLIACAADGAGSAKHSGKGSAIACERIVENASAYFEAHGNFDSLQAEDIEGWCDDVRRKIEEEAKTLACTSRDFATTLCTAIVSPTRSCFFQIGDGAIVASCNDTYGVVFWPQSGEYANSTNFLTAENYREHLTFLTTTQRFTNLAVFTDGLERLALSFENQTPHLPFFQPLFQTLRSTDNLAQLNEDLGSFLQSDSVKARSDDDKTLILACHVSERSQKHD